MTFPRPNKPMHLSGAFVLKELIVFVRSLTSLRRTVG